MSQLVLETRLDKDAHSTASESGDDVAGALWEVFNQDQATPAVEPPRKKRRISDSDRSVAVNQETERRYVPVHELVVKLDYSHGSSQLGHGRSGEPTSMPIHVQERSKRRAGAFNAPPGLMSLSIGTAAGHSATILLRPQEADADRDVGDTLVVLRETLILQRRKPSGKKTDSVRKSDVVTTEWYLVAPSEIDPSFTLHCVVKWLVGVRGIHFNMSDDVRQAAKRFLPGGPELDGKPWTLSDFYENVRCSIPNDEILDRFQPKDLASRLYPFQRRAVKWLLRREGCSLDEQGHIRESEAGQTDDGIFTKQEDRNGGSIEVSHLLEEVRPGPALTRPATLLGGILAEEMGLGKTVELIALILLHERSGPLPDLFHDVYTDSHVRPTRSTLIITPQHILGQWQDELARHGPTVRVYHYTGLHTTNASTEEISSIFDEHDVVLTTYSVLSRDFHYAVKPPARSLRHAKAHEFRRSPLVQLHWWRVCLDEAQMVDSGVTKAATVARLIPRVNAWAVSGTPLKKDIGDLYGLLLFLRHEPYHDRLVWKHLVGYSIRRIHEPNLRVGGHGSILSKLVSNIALRHSKSRLRDELELPPQKRVTITCSFTAVESQRYQDLYRQMCEEVGVNNLGGPLHSDWDPNRIATIEKMRSWLSRLRTTCLHAEIGVRNRRALGTRSKHLRTVDEVLAVMIIQNDSALRAQQRVSLNHRIIRGQLLCLGKQPSQALKLFQEVRDESISDVGQCRKQLEEEKTRIFDKDAKFADEHESDSASEDEDAAKERLGMLRQRLRSALELLHICHFHTATAYFQIKERADLTEPESVAWKELDSKERDCYDQAKAVRIELLLEVRKATNKLMEKVKISRGASRSPFSLIKSFQHFRGLESRKVTETVEKLMQLLNDHTKHLSELRDKLIDLLLKPLLDEEDVELTGEEYEDSTKVQDKQYVLLDMLRTGIADRHCAITGQLNQLINYEMREALKKATDGNWDDVEDKGHAPEMLIELLQRRQALVPSENLQISTAQMMPKPCVSIKAILTELRSMITSIQWQAGDRARAQSAILEQELSHLQVMSTTQLKDVDHFEKEVDLLRSCMNQRLEFYRQAQQISDAVTPLEGETTDEPDQARIASELEAETIARGRLSTLKTKQRFLNHLQTQSTDETEQRICVICQDPVEVGVMTICGHQFCKDCLQHWWYRSSTCPMCNRPLTASDIHQITYKPQVLRAKAESSTPASTHDVTALSPSKTSIYSGVSEETLNQIKLMDLPGASYGVKINMISRHLLWLREHDPGAKSIIFSQYRDFLTVLSSAFRAHKIGYTSITDKSGIEQFRNDPSKECFLLDAKADSSGLNLVNATHVFLCEPLVNAAIELQAIARVHRIGQKWATTVWLYLVADTVEEAIHELSIKRRLAHMQHSTGKSEQASRAATPGFGTIEEDKLEHANSLELRSASISKLLAAGPGGGELVATDDLWSCLFSNAIRPDAFAPTQLEGTEPAGHEVGAFLRAEAADARNPQGSRIGNMLRMFWR